MSLNKQKILTIAKGVALFLLGIVIPLGSFFLSSALTPVWKGGAKFGFLSLLLQAKIFLLPLTLWSVTAFFRTQIYPRREPKRWETIGLFLGVISAIFSLIAGFLAEGASLLMQPLGVFNIAVESSNFITQTPGQILEFFLGLPLLFLLTIAPFYTPIWYGWAAWKALREKRHQATSNTVTAAFISLPFMGAALIYAQQLYDKLPDTAPKCYVASASAMTPAYRMSMIVNPTTGQLLSRQLLTFKAFEYAWMESSVSSHSVFRSIYDVVGPVLARLIYLHPLLATLAYFSLKPAELVAWNFLQGYVIES